jgi:hypothetical protein
MLIKVQYTTGGPFSFEGCPDNIAEQAVEKQQQQQQQHSADGALGDTTSQLTVSTHVQALTMLCYAGNPDTHHRNQVRQLESDQSSAPSCKHRCVFISIACCTKLLSKHQ